MNYFFFGEESFLKQETIEDLKKKYLSKNSDKLNFTTYYAGTDPLENILSEAKTVPFMDRYRLILIKNVDKFNKEEKEILLSYFKAPSNHAILILDRDSDTQKGDFLNRVRKYVKIQNFFKASVSDKKAFIKKEIIRLKKKISKEALDLLNKLLEGSDIGTIKNEIDKLDIFTLLRRDINKADIEMIIGESMNETIFNLTEAIEKHDADRALRIISMLFLKKAKPGEVIGLLAWHLRKNALRNKREKTISKERMKDKTDLLLSCDLSIKRSRLDQKTALETVIMKLCTE